jgi:hypothetical protein
MSMALAQRRSELGTIPNIDDLILILRHENPSTIGQHFGIRREPRIGASNVPLLRLKWVPTIHIVLKQEPRFSSLVRGANQFVKEFLVSDRSW